MTATSERTTLTPWRLARLAECADPDSVDSPGARWLELVATVAEENAGADPDDRYQLVDDVVPIYTAEKWAVFTDLGAWDEDVSDFGPVATMDDGASWALYAIACRLLDALAEADATDDDDPDDDHDDDGPEPGPNVFRPNIHPLDALGLAAVLAGIGADPEPEPTWAEALDLAADQCGYDSPEYRAVERAAGSTWGAS